MTSYPHLVTEVANMLERSKKERVEFCLQDRWIGYTLALEALQELDDIFSHPKVLRMPNLLIVGRPNNGKTAILDRFIKSHVLRIGEDLEPSRCVLSVTMPATPTESNFWSQVLYSLLVRHNERDTPDRKRNQAYAAMAYANVAVLAIDEINHLTNAGKHAANILATLKNVNTDIKMPIVAAGTQAAINALNSDPQMKSRFRPFVLNRWQLDREYLRFLASYETFLPLPEPSKDRKSVV